MKIIEKLFQILHYNLDSDVFDYDQVYNALKTSASLKLVMEIRLYDFGYYNECLLKKLKQEKVIYVKRGQYELAANRRDQEKHCIEFIKFRNQLNFKQSIFELKDKVLIYFHFGNLKNDKEMVGLIKRTFKPIKVKSDGFYI